MYMHTFFPVKRNLLFFQLSIYHIFKQIRCIYDKVCDQNLFFTVGMEWLSYT